jgi:acid phosphatase
VQQQASDTTTYSIAPTITGAFATLPQPNTTYANGQPPNVPDSRFPANLPPGPFPLSAYVAYQLQFTGDPIHRFFQMWQQVDEGKMDLFTWVGVTVGTGPQNSPPAPTPANTFQGGVAMGFNNMSAGDAPVLKFIADHYAMSDNYHQAIMGGTGANFIFLGTADEGYFSDGNGTPLAPFANQIENPNPQPTTNNFYTQDGYGGGSYVNCADTSQPGVAPITTYLTSLGRSSNCAPNTYYLVNNYGPGFNPDGTTKPIDAAHFTLPPQTLPTIADALTDKGVSWRYYIGGWNGGQPNSSWCSICNPFEFVKSIMTDPSKRANIQDIPNFYQDLANGTLPAVSFIRPYEGYAGHPANSALSSYEDFVSNVANAVISAGDTFQSTAILATMDEGGGYYDSGYVQPLDFFGDGTRIPLVVISPYVSPGFIDHTYYDHTSVLKFIEANWGLAPLSGRSRDNLPNPIPSFNPYIPANGPAVGDLMNMFDFHHGRGKDNIQLIIAPGV